MTTESLFDLDLPQLVARHTDPSSSHAAAGRDFDIPEGVTGLAARVLGVVGPDEWRTCRQIIDDAFGPGPYTYDEAVALNKVQTVCLTLHRVGHLARLDLDDGEPLRYRRAH